MSEHITEGDPGPLEDANAAEPGAITASATEAGVLRSSAVMGVGTIASRISGVVRGAALAAAIGVAGPVADLFALGNTVPNIVYILVVGGALNAVFIPQLVKHMHNDDDGGSAFTDRLLTITFVVLAVTTVLSVLLAPWIVGLYSTSKYTPEQLQLAINITRLCLPQIVFYGMFTMLAQVLNSRNHFAAPMFAPIVNNVCSVGAFIAFFWVWGTEPAETGTLTTAQVLTLGLGATLGVVAQALVLVPVMRRHGYRFRPRFDFRGSGLGHVGSLASWTIGLVLINQIGYIVIVRLLTNAGAAATDTTAGGLAIYQNAHLVFILPHSIVTVSLVTALMPRMSAAVATNRLGDLASYVASGTRTAAAAIVLAAAMLIVLGPALADILFGYGAAQVGGESVEALGHVVSVFAVGLLPFTVYYVLLRGWYALEDTRTAFYMTVFLNIVNVALAVVAFGFLSGRGQTGSQLVLAVAAAYVVAYYITTALSWFVLRRRTGTLQSRETVIALIKISLAGLVSLAAMFAVQYLLHNAIAGIGKLATLGEIIGVGLVGLIVYLAVARLARIDEINDVLKLLRVRRS